jgi:hypothetical protein
LAFHLDCVVCCLCNVELEYDSAQYLFHLLNFLFKGTYGCYNGPYDASWSIVSGNSGTADNVGRWTIIKNSNWWAVFFAADLDAEVAAIAACGVLFGDVVNDKGSVWLGTDTVKRVASVELVIRLIGD